MCKCNRMKDIIGAELALVKRHINDYKWYNHIEDEEEAVVDFVRKYAWLMREVFCARICPDKLRCEVSAAVKSAFLHDISDGELTKFITEFRQGQSSDLTHIQLQLIKHHISMHKWIHGIKEYRDAVKDFLERFGWVIEDMLAVAKVD